MNVREENAARAMIQGFLKDSVPEYIKDTGQEILNSGGVHKLTIRKEEAAKIQVEPDAGQ